MITIVKLGGAVLEDNKKLNEFLNNFIQIKGKKILIHGGGRTSSDLMMKLGIEPKMVDGRRITDSVALEIVTMAYSGLNKKIVAKLQSLNCNSIGLCGADENVLSAIKRPSEPIDFGWVGDVSKNNVHTDVLHGYLKHDIVPVIAPLTHDGKGNLLNTNADTIASIVAQSLSRIDPVRLIYAFEKKGLLSDINDENSVIKEMNSSEYKIAINQSFIHTGMIPKLNNAFAALKQGVKEVYICHIKEINTLHIATRLVN